MNTTKPSIKRSILAMLTGLAILILLMPANVDAATKTKNISTIKAGTKVTVGELKYKVTKVTKKGGNAIVIGVDKKATTVNIPATIKVNVKKGAYKGLHTITVTAIDKNTFFNNRKITKVTIGSNVKTIGEKAFYKTTKLKQVSIGKNVSSIGKYAFASDINLRTVSIAKNSKLTKIGTYAFKSCVNLRTFSFGNAKKLNTIGSFAFYGCDLLKNVPMQKTAEMQAVINEAKKYTYEVQPLFPSFNYAYYVKTNNPDGTKFRLVDRNSTMYDEDTEEDDYISIMDQAYADVVYTDEKASRVNGGYLCRAKHYELDGGALNLEIYTNLLDPRKKSFEWVDTGIKVNAPTAMSARDYLINNYTNDSMSFFEKLDAIESALYKMAIYPKGTYDSTQRNEGSYPLLATSPYYELGLNQHYEGIFKKSEKKILAYWCYPYVLDSLGFPGTISSIAKRLEPSCQVKSGSVHYLISVTYNGETRNYGGAGSGGTNELYTSCISDFYKFDGSEDDLGTNPSLEKASSAYFQTARASSALIAQFKDQLSGDTFKQKVGNGNWLMVGRESFFGGGGNSYARYYKTDYATNLLSLASGIWIDGRYVNNNEFFELGTSFESHPTASVVLTNRTYTTYYGKTYQGDMVFRYNKTKDRWECDQYFYKGYNGYYFSYGSPSGVELPAEFVLTKEQLQSLGVDSNKDSYPSQGLIYNGTAEPGTPYSK